MADTNTRLLDLYNRYISDQATEEELKEFWAMVRNMQDDDPLHDRVYRLYAETAGQSSGVDWSKAEEKIFDKAPAMPVPVHRIHFLKTAWFKYAAAVIIMIGIGAYLWNTQQKEKPSVTQTNPVPVQNDVAPGGNKAILRLADGREITLDNAANGELAREENARITKTAEGRIVYDATEKLGDKILYNTMATPRGGQYQLTLPDGSQVWLNAESSITYPTAFTGTERKVSITGEAYFEVTKNKKPFQVEAGKTTIEVLGTHFNVNTYKEEPTINTTLLEGLVKIKSVHTSLILKPGQQGQLNPRTEKLSLAVQPDVEQVMAWKNGRFQFENTDLQTIMRQLSRAYDVDVKFEGTVNEKFGGGISRSVNLSQVLKMLELAGKVHFRIEGHTVYVRP